MKEIRSSMKFLEKTFLKRNFFVDVLKKNNEKRYVIEYKKVE